MKNWMQEKNNAKKFKAQRHRGTLILNCYQKEKKKVVDMVCIVH